MLLFFINRPVPVTVVVLVALGPRPVDLLLLLLLLSVGAVLLLLEALLVVFLSLFLSLFSLLVLREEFDEDDEYDEDDEDGEDDEDEDEDEVPLVELPWHPVVAAEVGVGVGAASARRDALMRVRAMSCCCHSEELHCCSRSGSVI